MKVKRNKFGAPVGIILHQDDGLLLRRLREKDAHKTLPKRELEAAIKHFKEAYPVKDVAATLKVMSQGSRKEDVEDLLGGSPDDEGEEGDEGDEGDEGEEQLTVQEMRDALKEAGVPCSPNAKDETVQKKYEDAFAEGEE